MGASDFFASVREAASEAARIERRIERMRGSLQGGSSGVASASGARADVHGTAAIDRAIDYEARVRPVLDADRALVERARRVLYGDDGDGGVAKGIGSDYADAVWWRACEARTWDEVADACAASRSTAKRWYSVAIDYIDAVGFEGADEGAGV